MELIKHGFFKAADRPTVLEAALAYLDIGVSAIPLRGKVPSIDWVTYQIRRAPFSYAHEWARRGLMSNVGIVCGEVSNNLCVIDLDGLDAVDTFKTAFPRLLKTYTVESGSGKGLHIYLQSEKLPPTTRTRGYELRANGTQVVAPPSRHPDTGRRYVPQGDHAVLVVPDLDNVVQWITELIKAKQGTTPAPAAPRVDAPPNLPKDVYARNGVEMYFNRAIQGETDRVISASPGTQNDALFRASRNLAKKINAGLSIERIETVMLDAAARAGYTARHSQRQALATIRSGITWGIRQQRDVPPSTPPMKGDRHG